MAFHFQEATSDRNGAQEMLPGGAEFHQRAASVSRLMLTYFLFWPLLCLIARQAPYFAGPARDAASFQQGRSAGEGSDYHAQLYLIMAIEAICAASCARAIVRTLKRNPLIPAALGLALVSTLWSGSKMNSLHLWVELSLSTLFACYLAVRMPPERLMNQLMFVGSIAALLSIVFAVALPSYGVFAGYGGSAWQGICDHKNTLGLSMAYLLTPAFFVDCRRWQRLTYISLIVFLIGMSQSRGAWLYTAGLVLFVASLHLVRRLKSHESVLLRIVLCMIVLVIAAAVTTSFGSMASMLGKDASMTGRTDIYREVWASILRSPIVGYGYGGFWGVNPEATRIGLSIGWTSIGYSENGILELALQLGIAGVGLVVWLIARAVVQGVSLLRSPHYRPRTGWFLAILSVAALSNIDAGWLLSTGTLDWAMILIACIGLDAEWRRARDARLADASLREISQNAPSLSGEQVAALALAGASLQL